MDKISESMLNEFADERDLTKLPEDLRFEHFACFLTVSKHYSKTFETEDLLMGKGHRMEPYYAAAYALYRLEHLFRNRLIDAKYKPARFHILLASRLLTTSQQVPLPNSKEMEKYCKPIMDTLWDQHDGQGLLFDAVDIIDEVAAGDFDRDKIRTESFTKSVQSKFGGKGKL